MQDNRLQLNFNGSHAVFKRRLIKRYVNIINNFKLKK